MIENQFLSILQYDEQDDLPEYRLLRSILKVAILDYLSSGTGPSSLSSNQEKDKRNAKRWLFYEPVHDNSAPFSFGWICQHLNPDYKFLSTEIRKAVLVLQKETQREHEVGTQ